MKATVLLFLMTIAAAADRPDFSGAWALDKDRSFSNPPGFDQTLAVSHKGDEIKLEAKIKTAQGDRTINEEFVLDGKERSFTPPTEGAKGLRKSYWLPGERGIVVEDRVTTDSPAGAVTQLTIRKWILSSDHRTLTIDYYMDTPRGSFESKRVFTRK